MPVLLKHEFHSVWALFQQSLTLTEHPTTAVALTFLGQAAKHVFIVLLVMGAIGDGHRRRLGPAAGRLRAGHQVGQAERGQAEPDQGRQADLRPAGGLGGRQDAAEEQPRRAPGVRRHPRPDAPRRRHGAGPGDHPAALPQRPRPDAQHRARRPGAGRRRLRHAAPARRQADPDEQGRGQAGAQAERGRPDAQGRDPGPPARRLAQPDDRRRGDRRRGPGQPDPRRGGPALRVGAGRPARRGPGRRRDRRQDQGARGRGAGPAGPRHPARPVAVRLHQRRPDDPQRALRGRRDGPRVRDQPAYGAVSTAASTAPPVRRPSCPTYPPSDVVAGFPQLRSQPADRTPVARRAHCGARRAQRTLLPRKVRPCPPRF